MIALIVLAIYVSGFLYTSRKLMPWWMSGEICVAPGHIEVGKRDADCKMVSRGEHRLRYPKDVASVAWRAMFWPLAIYVLFVANAPLSSAETKRKMIEQQKRIEESDKEIASLTKQLSAHY